MLNTEFEKRVKSLQDRLRMLPGHSVAVFSAACAERLAVFYEQFTIEHGWDCYQTARKILDLCWDVLLGRDGERDELKVLSGKLLECVPHGDDFTGILCTGAQDFAACVESATKWIFLAPNARYGAVYYPLEVLYARATLGRINKPLGDASTAADDSDVMDDPAIVKEFAAQANDLTFLETNMSLTTKDIDSIRNSAVENRHRLESK